MSAPSDSAYIVSTIGEDQTWTQVPSDVMCFTAVQDVESADTFNACDLFINAEVPAQGFRYFKVEAVSPDTENAAVAAPLHEDRHIENENLHVQYLEQDEKDRAVFQITDKQENSQHKMAFSLQYYNPSVGNGVDTSQKTGPSGAYLFIPSYGDMEKRQFSDFVKIETYKTASTGVS